MDRNIVFEGAIPQDVDILNLNKNVLISLGFALQAILGGSTVVDGLACTPTGPASLNVLLAQGSIYSTENVDATAYGSINSDTAHQIVKQGITSPLGTLTIPASGTFAVPSTTGFSVAYLVQGQYQDVDDGSTVLPYYNASNPAVAYNGPNNTGVSQNTMRQGKFVISVKAGTAATTGTQVTPTPDAGYTGLWVVTVANGTTAITSGMIALYPGAPFINYKLPQLSPTSSAVRTLLSGTANYYVSTSGNDSTGTGSSGAPWATWQHAVNYVLDNIDSGGNTININASGAGTFTAGAIMAAPLVGGGTLQLIGDPSTAAPTPPNVIISATSADCFAAMNGGVLTIKGFTCETATQGNCINCLKGGRIILNGNMSFGNMGGQGSDITVNNVGELEIASSFSTTGNKVCTLEAHAIGILNATGGITCTLTGTPVYSGAFASSTKTGFLELSGIVYSGGGSGLQYILTGPSLIDTNGNTTNWPTGLSGNTTVSPGTIQ